MSYDLIELTLSRLGAQLPERLSSCLEPHQTYGRSGKSRSGILRQSADKSECEHDRCAKRTGEIAT